MAIPFWAPATLYQPGDLVQRRTGAPTVQSAPENANFEAGNTGWDGLGTALNIVNSPAAPKFDGAYVLEFSGSFEGEYQSNNDNAVPVVPGQTIQGQCYINTTGSAGLAALAGYCQLLWYDSTPTQIATSQGGVQAATNQGWGLSVVSGVAPAGAAYCRIGVFFYRRSPGLGWGAYADTFSWNYVYADPPDGLVYRAVQSDAGMSGTTEPVWPVTEGQTVVDNEVTWEAVVAARVTWEATAILVSGSTEPTWPTVPGTFVADNTISWEATTGNITDTRCPNTIPVAIAASKIFAGDDDIVGFSATVNPRDWTTRDDAGYLPFGLQTYGANPVTALGLYRSNLVVFNSEAFQMWQVDQDPASMALLDAVPIGCTFHLTVQPFANDLLFLSSQGYRNVGIAGASTNLQAAGIGEPIDPLVKVKLRADEYEPFSLTFPTAGQYWGVFGDEAFVLTVNDVKSKTWSRYTFPEVLTDWTIHGSDLYLRAGDKVWRVDENLNYDDVVDPVTTFTLGGNNRGGVMVAEDDNDWTGFADMGTPEFGSFTGSVADLDDSQDLTLIGLYYARYDGFFDIVITGSDSAPAQDVFDTLSFTDLDGNLQEFSSADADYITDGNDSYWSFAHATELFADGESYQLSFTLTGTQGFEGYDPFNDVGTLESTTLTDHTILLAAYNRDASRFEVYVSNILGQNAFESLALYGGDDTLTAELLARLDVSDAQYNNVGNVVLGAVTYPLVGVYTWAVDNPFGNETDFSVVLEGFTLEQTGEDIVGLVQWPHLDLGNLGVEKNMVGLDLVATAPEGVSVSIGYNQRDLSQRTDPYAVDADTLTGMLVPFPVSGPSFDLQLTFEPGQSWEFFAANLYIQDLRLGA